MYIKEVAKKLKVTTRTIRHYEELGVVESRRLDNNYRYFNEENIDKLKFIVKARNLAFSIDECKELIKLFKDNNRQSAQVRDIAKTKLEMISIKIKELASLKSSLQQLVDKCPGNDKPDCPIIDELSKN